MCGIVGKVRMNINEADFNEVVEMRDAIMHRGPDDYGIHQCNNCILGHRRLSIIDLSANGHQPMISKDGKFIITYNGEIYNYKEIRENHLKEYEFTSNTDTEVVLYSFIKFGSKALNLFNGMFAFAIWDTVKQQLFIARDRFGQKPLYYYLTDNSFYFASEIKAFEKVNGINLKISMEGLNNYLSLGYVLSPLTIYQNLYQLEPANYAYVNNEGKVISRNKYWHYENYFGNKHKENYEVKKQNIYTLLESSVKRRMLSDVPLGSFLSGGIDSSIVSYLLNLNHKSNKAHTFSIGFQSKDYSEINDANKVAKFLNTLHTGKIIDYKDYNKYFNDAISGMDGLLGDNSFIPMIAVSELASKDVKVVLSGDGGDEIFGGYITYKSDILHRYSSILPRGILKVLAKRRNTNRNKKIGFNFKAQQFSYGSTFDYRKAHYSWRLIFRPEERVNILGEKYREMIYDTDPFLKFSKFYNNVNELCRLDQHFYVDAMTWMTDDILVKVDRSSMLHGIEARAPFLDKDLVEYAAGLLPSDKLNILNSKIILKDAFREKLPEFVFQKKKSGFNFPISNFLTKRFTNEFQDYCYYLLQNKYGHLFESD